MPNTPSGAEIARTLARGRLPGLLQVEGRPEPYPVPHATDRTGRPLLLVPGGGRLSGERDGAEGRGVAGERDATGGRDVTGGRDATGGPVAVLSVADVPPVPDAPSLGQVRIEGRPHRLGAAAAAAAVQEFAEVNPIADLLDVGRGAELWRVEVARVRLHRPRAVLEVDFAAYAAAAPDPLHELEADLLADLAGHHATQIESYFRCLLAVTGWPCPVPPRAVRLDRYGFVVDAGGPGADPARRWVRLGFTRPVHCRHDLAHLLHPVLFPVCPDPPR